MRTFIYSHKEGKLVEESNIEIPTESSSLDVKRRYCENVLLLKEYTAIGFSQEQDGKEFREDEFKTKSCDCGIGHDCKYGNDVKPCIIAVPIEKRSEERSQDELLTPIGDFILNQKDIPGVDCNDGKWFHYSEVYTLLNRLKQSLNQTK